MERNEFSVRGRQVVVVGAALSGIAAAELLLRRGARVTLSESRPHVESADHLQAAGVRLEVGGHREATLTNADLIVVSPGVPVTQPVFDAPRRAGVEIVGELELASRWIAGRIVAITGTKGKSTTATLVKRMLEADGRDVRLSGNIGVPLSVHVEESTPATLHVVEVSSFQLETTTTFHPWIAAWLNFAVDHLDRHPDVEAYAAAKARIFANQTPDDWAVVNADDSVVVARSARARARQVRFSLEGGVEEGFVVDGGWVGRRTSTGTTRLLPVSSVELTGRHMLGNVLAAVAMVSIAGVQLGSMAEALHGFQGLEHAMEPAGGVGGVRFVNDSKATNVEAARRSIEAFASGVVAIIGGRFKGGDLRDLREPLVTRGRAVIAIGEAAPLVRDALEGTVPVLEAQSMREAVQYGYDAAAPDGVVLLAPACASFDWYHDYAERGRVFKDEVQQLKERVGC